MKKERDGEGVSLRREERSAERSEARRSIATEMNEKERDGLINRFKERVDSFCETLKSGDNFSLMGKYTMMMKYLTLLVEESGQEIIKEQLNVDRVQIKASDVVACLSPGDSCILCLKQGDMGWHESRFYGRDRELEEALLCVTEDGLKELGLFDIEGIDWLRDKLIEREERE